MRRAAVLCLVACGGSTPPPSAHAEMAADLAITHVTVIDAVSGARPDQTVLVAGDRIVAVAAGIAVPARARVVSGAGRFLIPGLWDMHVHTGPPELYAPMYLANGVVGVRDMGGEAEPPVGNLSLPVEKLRAFRDRVRKHEARGPTMYLAGPMVDGDPAVWPNAIALKSPIDVPAAFDTLQARGVDFVKIYQNLDHDTFLAVAAEAHRRNLDFAGHLPSKVDPEIASEAGQKSFEHLIGVWPACSPLREDLTHLLATSKDTTERVAMIEKTLETVDVEVCKPLLAQLARNQTWQDPTLVIWSHYATVLDPTNLTDPRLVHMPGSVREVWKPENPFYWHGKAAIQAQVAPKILAADKKIVAAMFKAGVPILAGSDSGNPNVYPGWGLHEELALLVSAGLSPLDALGAATIMPARYFGIESTHGTIATGKVADLVLLDANPLEAIANTRKIAGVMHDGEWLDRAQLDAILSAARPDTPSP